MKLILENIRSFRGRHELPIRPLTILVGENSTGKTTVLAALAEACDIQQMTLWPDFNSPPYALGGFESIASRKQSEPKQDRPEHFAFGLDFPDTSELPGASFLVKCCQDEAGQTQLSSLVSHTSDGSLEFKFDGARMTAEVTPSPKRKPLVVFEEVPTEFLRQAPMLGLFTALLLSPLAKESAKRGWSESKWMSPLFFFTTSRFFSETISIAPVRTKPKLTYEPLQDAFTPEGDHVPLFLAKILDKRSNEKTRKSMIDSIRKFGRESGLFKNVKVTRLGNRPGDPFRVMVQVPGLTSNLPYVGYGVSQALPIIVDSLRARSGTRILMQQPEVHLHPRAQAALGSLFASLVVKEKKQFVIETHSDYIVDRVRREVAEKRLKQESVVILYFERTAARSKVYPIYVDGLGNLDGAPPTFRQFFLEEEMKRLRGGG